MNFLQIGITGAVLVSLVGCSTPDGKRIDYGAAALQVPTLEVPPDLTAPEDDGRFKVPQDPGANPKQATPNGVAGVATYSDYTKGRTVSPVLPEIQGVHMERNNAQRWLVINDKAENVWPVVRAFWQEIGLAIGSEDEAAGVMETAWAENRAKITQSDSQNLLDKEFNNAFVVAGERDQYSTRLERSKNGASTEVYITHRGIKEEFSANKRTSEWVARANDPELEAIMLQRLMVRFGVSETKAASAVAAVSPATVAATTSAVTVIPPEPVGMSSLREVSGSTIIFMNDAFDRSWRKVGLAIEGAGLAVEDKDREKGIYYLRPVKLESGFFDKLMFWKSREDSTRHYRVNVKDGGTSCVVSIVDQDGASNKISKQMLEAIYKNINQ